MDHAPAIIALAALTAAAHADIADTHTDLPLVQPQIFYEIDVSGMSTWDIFGDPDNEIISVYLGSFANITAIEWDLTVQTAGSSWLSDVSFAFLDHPNQLTITPGMDSTMPGLANFTSPPGFSLDPSDYFNVGADGILEIELFETVDDNANAVDATFLAGSYIRVLVPAPSGAAAFGALSLLAARRRR